MKNIRVLYIITALLLLCGCGKNPTMNFSSNNDPVFTKISSSEANKQDISNQIKVHLSKYEELTSIKAMNTTKSMIIAVEVNHFKRLQLAKIRKKISKAVKKELPDMDITVSTDKKISLELSRLEEKIQSKSLSKKEIDKKIKDIIKLAKEET